MIDLRETIDWTELENVINNSIYSDKPDGWNIKDDAPEKIRTTFLTHDHELAYVIELIKRKHMTHITEYSGKNYILYKAAVVNAVMYRGSDIAHGICFDVIVAETDIIKGCDNMPQAKTQKAA